jgi:hypothetical protein
MNVLLGIVVLLAGGPLVQQSISESESRREEIKSDLVGHKMGGREEGWKFQSVSQIKELTIDDTKEEANARVLTVTLRLEDSRVSGAYQAKALLTYEKEGSDWKLESVGLLSMKRLE